MTYKRTSRLKTPISYYGGKQTLLKYILPLIPPHTIYTEAFFGGGAVFFAKEPAQHAIINDRNGEVVNFYEQVQRNYVALQKLIFATAYSRATYKAALTVYSLPSHFSPVKRAWAFWVVTNQGFSSSIGSWAFDKKGAKLRALNSKKKAFTTLLQQRLQAVTIECKDALQILTATDSSETFHYVDPPYLGADQGHYHGYTDKDFSQLLEVLRSLQGKFLLSFYPNDALQSVIEEEGWEVQRVTKKITAGITKGGKRRDKVEMLVMNY